MRRHLLLVPERNVVYVKISSKLGKDTTLVAPCVPLRRLAARVTLPNGVKAIDAWATVTARAEAVPTKDPSDPTEWRSVPIKVKVELWGYDALEFEWRRDEEPAREHRLEPAR